MRQLRDALMTATARRASKCKVLISRESFACRRALAFF